MQVRRKKPVHYPGQICNKLFLTSSFRLSLVIYPDGSIGSLEQDGCCSCQLESIVEMSQVTTILTNTLYF